MKKLRLVAAGAVLLLLAMAFAGCASQSKSAAPAVPGISRQAQGTAIMVISAAGTRLVPWSEMLTLRQALIPADFPDAARVYLIAVVREGQRPVFLDSKVVMQGQDMLLEKGDRVEVHPP